MMYQLFLCFIIAILEASIFYVFYLAHTREAKLKLEKEWQDKNDQLKSWENDLRSKYAQMEWKCTVENNNISQKKSEAIQEYEKAFNAIKVAEKIRDDAHLKINELQKRINQLQSELFQSRKRTERLANKAKKEVKIST